MTGLLILGLLGCENGLTLPPDDGGGYQGPLKPSLRLKTRPRRYILPGYDSALAPPEPAIRAEQCDDITDGGEVAGPSCATSTISCGDTIIGHTVGGVDQFDTRFYESHFCTPATTDHNSGDERVYKLQLPQGDWKAFVTLDTPCADLDIAALKWSDDTCPTPSAIMPQCEMSVQRGTWRDRMELVSQNGSTWWIVVEGKDDAEGPFALHVQCRRGLL